MTTDFQSDLITVDTSELVKFYGTKLPRLRGVFHKARRALMNNMGFAVRAIVIDWGIPRVMTIRNRNIIRATLFLQRATRDNEVVQLRQESKGAYWSALRAQEFGGPMERQPANKLARGGDPKKKMKQQVRLIRGRDYLDPDDPSIKVRGDKGRAHRTHVFLEMLQRPNGIPGQGVYHKGPFVLGHAGGFRPGLMVLGKLRGQSALSERLSSRSRFTPGSKFFKAKVRKMSKTRQIHTLRTFEKGQKRVRRLLWLRPSIDKYLRQADARMEWRRAINWASKGTISV